MNAGVAAFVDCTEAALREPGSPADRAVDVMFQNRYDYSPGLYDWAYKL